MNDQQQPINPFEETNQLLEQILESNNTDAEHSHSLLENLIELQVKDDDITPLLENQLEMQDKIVEGQKEVVAAIKELKDQTWEINLILE